MHWLTSACTLAYRLGAREARTVGKMISGKDTANRYGTAAVLARVAAHAAIVTRLPHAHGSGRLGRTSALLVLTAAGGGGLTPNSQPSAELTAVVSLPSIAFEVCGRFDETNGPIRMVLGCNVSNR